MTGVFIAVDFVLNLLHAAETRINGTPEHRVGQIRVDNHYGGVVINNDPDKPGAAFDIAVPVSAKYILLPAADEEAAALTYQ
jgi:hypothetical protein